MENDLIASDRTRVKNLIFSHRFKRFFHFTLASKTEIKRVIKSSFIYTFY